MLNQFFGSRDTKWAYVLLKKLFSNKKIDFLKITYKNVQSFNLVHVQEAIFFFF